MAWKLKANERVNTISVVSVIPKRNLKYFVIKNVNNLLYMDNRRNFRTILAA